MTSFSLKGTDKVQYGHQLTNILNMQHVLSGGYNTEYSLYLIKNLLTIKSNCSTDYYVGAMDILEQMSAINWTTVQKRTGSGNKHIIFENMAEIAGIIVMKRPELATKLKNIISVLKDNNKDADLHKFNFTLDEILQHHFYDKLNVVEAAGNFKPLQKGGRE